MLNALLVAKAGLELTFGGSAVILAALAILALSVAIFVYRQTLPPTSRPLRILLAALRAVALMLILFLIFEPSLSFFRERRLKPLLAVIFDDTQSLTIQDASGPRRDQLRRLMLDPAWSGIRAKFDLNVFAAGDSLRPLPQMAPDSLALKTIGTDLAGAWQGVLARQEAQDFAAILLISDGGDNVGRDPQKEAIRVPVPIYTLGVGDTAAVRDASISSLAFEETAYRDKETEITVRLRARGMEDQAASLELRDTQGRILARQNVKLPPDGLEAENSVKFTPNSVGRLPLILQLSSSSQERSSENNQRAIVLHVQESRIRVLVLTGLPNFESMFFQRALSELEDFELTALTVARNGEILGNKGVPLAQSLAQAQALILMNWQAPDVTPATQERLGRAFQDHPLPVWIWFGPTSSLQAAKPLVPDFPFTFYAARPSTETDVVLERYYAELDPDAETNESPLWNGLPPLTAPSSSLITESGAKVLLSLKGAQTGEGLGPALALGESPRRFAASFGSGYWKWGFLTVGMGGSEELYLNLIDRVLRWLAADPQKNPVKIAVEREVYSVGETVRFEGRVLGGDGKPSVSAQMEVEIAGPAGSSRIILEPNATERYAGQTSPEVLGAYKYRGWALMSGDALGSDSGSFMVEAYNVEMETLTQNRQLLEAISTASGGRYVPADSLTQLANMLSAPPRVVKMNWQRRFFLNWDILLLLVLFLALEWFIRKRRGML